MPQTPADVLQDPNFKALPVEERRKVLLHLDSRFGSLPRTEQDKVIGGSIETPPGAAGGATGEWSPDYSRTPILGPLARFGKSAVDTGTGMITGIYHSLTDEPQTPEEFAVYAAGAPTGLGRVALALHRNLTAPQIEEAHKAADKNLSTTERIGHGLAATVPFVGPMAADIGETLGTEGLPEAAGKAAAYSLAPKVLEKISTVGELRTKAREAARSAVQTPLGAGAEKTTGKFVDEYNQARKGFKQEAAQTIETNKQNAKAASRLETTQRSLAAGSQVLGDRVKDLDSKLRIEGNEKYQAVSKAVADDSEPLKDLVDAVQHAESKIIKGSPESIKQFRDLVRKGGVAEASPLTANGLAIAPGDPLYQRLQAEGAIPETPDTGLKFDQLQGYSSELGDKLASGNLPGDVYQALKYVKGKIDEAKTRIADRNGAGGLLRDADKFWNRYMDTFYDSDSAVAKVRESVGVVDPQFYTEPFTKGKSADVAVSKLKTLPTRHAADASAIADLANNLRSAHNEIASTAVPKPKALPTYPTAPTVEDITGAKQKAVQSKSAELVALRRFDAMVLAGSVLAPLLGADPIHSLIGGAGAIGVEKSIAASLNRPAVVSWISKPTPADLAAVSRLPEPVRAKLGAQLRQIVDQERAQHPTLKVDPRVTGLIAASSGALNASKPVRTRQEAMDLLNSIR